MNYIVIYTDNKLHLRAYEKHNSRLQDQLHLKGYKKAKRTNY